MRYDYAEIKDFLDREMNVKTSVIGFLGMMLIFGLVDVVYGGRTFFSLQTIVYMVIYVIFTIWGAVIFIKNSKVQINLYAGVFGIVMSLMLLKLFYIMIKEVLLIKTDIIFILAGAIYTLIIILSFLWLHRALKHRFFSGKEKKRNVSYAIIGGFSIIGILSFKIINLIGNDTVKRLSLALSVLIISYIIELLIIGIYKYYLIKRLVKC